MHVLSSRGARLASLILLVALSSACVGALDQGALGPGPRPIPELDPQPLHRLNQLEYNNTVRDLLGTTLRPADAFPPDPESNGFDNQIDALQLTPTLLDRYFAAAQTVIDDALDDRPLYLHRVRPAEVGAGGFPVGDLWRLQGNVFQVTVTVPEGGASVTLLAGGSITSSAPAPTLRFELDGAIVEDFAVRGSAASPQAHTHAVTLSAGAHVLRYSPLNFINDAPANISNDVMVRYVEVRADTIISGPGRDRVYVCASETPAWDDPCYPQIIATFARRAWRRPLAAEEERSLGALYDALRVDGESDDQAMRLVLRAIMTSPRFVYRVTRVADAIDPDWLDPYVLASRLSYFLWSSMPDERLLAQAASGELTTEEGLTRAVDRMLVDERAAGFLDGFVEQWLSLRPLATVARSEAVYPGFDARVRSAMEGESRMLVADFLSNDEPMLSLLRPDFAYLNDSLAAHYGLPPVGSEELVRVDAAVSGRAGLLSLGAWLAVEADSEHSSPIKRGRWISDRILCHTIPSPPAGLVIEPVVPGDDESVRAALERHRSDRTCASCHAFLDVLGMGFEEFDGVGRQRSDPGLDTLGELPGGATFEGAQSMARVLDEERFVQCVAQKLFSYSMGRPPTGAEHESLAVLAQRATRDASTLPDLIRAIVLTPAFRAPLRGADR